MTDVYSEVKVVYDRRGGPDTGVPTTTTTGVNTTDVAPIGPEQDFLDQAAANRGVNGPRPTCSACVRTLLV